MAITSKMLVDKKETFLPGCCGPIWAYKSTVKWLSLRVALKAATPLGEAAGLASGRGWGSSHPARLTLIQARR